MEEPKSSELLTSEFFKLLTRSLSVKLAKLEDSIISIGNIHPAPDEVPEDSEVDFFKSAGKHAYGELNIDGVVYRLYIDRRSEITIYSSKTDRAYSITAFDLFNLAQLRGMDNVEMKIINLPRSATHPPIQYREAKTDGMESDEGFEPEDDYK